MKPIAPSRAQLGVLRAIAGAGFEYSAAKRLCSDTGCQLAEDEPDLGFVQYSLWIGPSEEDRRLLSVGTPELDGPPHIYLPLYYFEDEEGGDPDSRLAFDEAYRRLADGIGLLLGQAERAGTYEYAHRLAWPYSYSAWRVPEAQIFLVQDEHDIQFGMDVSLWLFRPQPTVAVPLPL